MDADSLAAQIERDIKDAERLKALQFTDQRDFQVKITTRSITYNFPAGEYFRHLSIYFTSDEQPNPFAVLSSSGADADIFTKVSAPGSRTVHFRVILINTDGVARSMPITWLVKSNDTGAITW